MPTRLVFKVSVPVPQFGQFVAQPNLSVKLEPYSPRSCCRGYCFLASPVLSGCPPTTRPRLVKDRICKLSIKNCCYKSKPRYLRSNGLLATYRIGTKQDRKYMNLQTKQDVSTAAYAADSQLNLLGLYWLDPLGLLDLPINAI
ncbi:hypothetical protein ACTXT7_000974 [Hymenolepis weldensis]